MYIEGYSRDLVDEHDEPVKVEGTLHLCKDGKYRVAIYTLADDVYVDHMLFNDQLDAWDWLALHIEEF